MHTTHKLIYNISVILKFYEGYLKVKCLKSLLEEEIMKKKI